MQLKENDCATGINWGATVWKTIYKSFHIKTFDNKKESRKTSAGIGKAGEIQEAWKRLA